MVSNERYTELAELAGGFIHDIKNHISNLTLHLDLLAEDLQGGETPREKRALTKAQKLRTECEHLVEVSNHFLRFARITDLDREPCDLTDVVEELIDFFMPTAQQANINIRPLLPADLPPVCLNREMFKEALLNLFLNAQQAMPTGGVLTIQANLETALTDENESKRSDSSFHTSDTVCLYIIDTGVGIPGETAEQIFRPFFSTRPGGTGLGLPITRRIIEAHGGTIDVQSAVGRGTRFLIRLPVDRSRSPGDGRTDLRGNCEPASALPEVEPARGRAR
ncbi:MAG: two-component sensor histidine kinase [Planctomycetes bacterium]|nr:two-component sensor histidine kinase [Planctomycetota bacterium]